LPSLTQYRSTRAGSTGAKNKPFCYTRLE
jgi:hypothetical protein